VVDDALAGTSVPAIRAPFRYGEAGLGASRLKGHRDPRVSGHGAI
jgi:hypothetical protein